MNLNSLIEMNCTSIIIKKTLFVDKLQDYRNFLKSCLSLSSLKCVTKIKLYIVENLCLYGTRLKPFPAKIIPSKRNEKNSKVKPFQKKSKTFIDIDDYNRPILINLYGVYEMNELAPWATT